MDVGLPEAEVRDPPACLAEILRHAAVLGTRLGTYVRIDFFATDRGCVFNEFSSMPGGGRDYTPVLRRALRRALGGEGARRP